MDNLVTDIGVGGVLALLIIREVLNFLKGRNGKKGELGLVGNISREEFEMHKKDVRYRDACDERHEAIQRQFVDMKTEIKDGFETIKELIKLNKF